MYTSYTAHILYIRQVLSSNIYYIYYIIYIRNQPNECIPKKIWCLSISQRSMSTIPYRYHFHFKTWLNGTRYIVSPTTVYWIIHTWFDMLQPECNGISRRKFLKIYGMSIRISVKAKFFPMQSRVE